MTSGDDHSSPSTPPTKIANPQKDGRPFVEFLRSSLADLLQECRDQENETLGEIRQLTEKLHSITAVRIALTRSLTSKALQGTPPKRPGRPPRAAAPPAEVPAP